MSKMLVNVTLKVSKIPKFTFETFFP